MQEKKQGEGIATCEGWWGGLATKCPATMMSAGFPERQPSASGRGSRGEHIRSATGLDREWLDEDGKKSWNSELERRGNVECELGKLTGLTRGRLGCCRLGSTGTGTSLLHLQLCSSSLFLAILKTHKRSKQSCLKSRPQCSMERRICTL